MNVASVELLFHFKVLLHKVFRKQKIQNKLKRKKEEKKTEMKEISLQTIWWIYMFLFVIYSFYFLPVKFKENMDRNDIYSTIVRFFLGYIWSHHIIFELVLPIFVKIT